MDYRISVRHEVQMPILVCTQRHISVLDCTRLTFPGRKASWSGVPGIYSALSVRLVPTFRFYCEGRGKTFLRNVCVH